MLTYINLFLLTSHQTIEELLFSCWEPSVHPQGSTIKNGFNLMTYYFVRSLIRDRH